MEIRNGTPAWAWAFPIVVCVPADQYGLTMPVGADERHVAVTFRMGHAADQTGTRIVVVPDEETPLQARVYYSSFCGWDDEEYSADDEVQQVLNDLWAGRPVTNRPHATFRNPYHLVAWLLGEEDPLEE